MVPMELMTMQDELLLTVPEAARRQRISPRHLWSLISSGRFGPGLIRLGRSVRIRADELSDWLAAGAPPKDRWVALRGAGR